MYPEVVHNHFKHHHAVDDHNARQHSPISIEVVWATKCWPNCVFAFLLSITEVNCFLAESYFTTRKSDSMMEFRKSLVHQLIENRFLEQESRAEHRRSARIQQSIGHGLLHLPPFKKILNGRIVNAKSRYPQKKCDRCHRGVQTYCKCTPGIYLCSHCIANHIEECQIIV